MAEKQFHNVKENRDRKWNTPKNRQNLPKNNSIMSKEMETKMEHTQKWTKSAKNTPRMSKKLTDAKKLTNLARKHKTCFQKSKNEKQTISKNILKKLIPRNKKIYSCKSIHQHQTDHVTLHR